MIKTDDIGVLIKNLSDSLKRMANASFKSFDITGTQVQVLGFLNSQKDCTATQKELETFLKVSHPTVNGILKRLEEKNIVSTKLFVDKRINKSVAVTKKGIELGHELEKNKDEHEKMLGKSLTAAERKQLKILLKKILDSIDD